MPLLGGESPTAHFLPVLASLQCIIRSLTGRHRQVQGRYRQKQAGTGREQAGSRQRVRQKWAGSRAGAGRSRQGTGRRRAGAGRRRAGASREQGKSRREQAGGGRSCRAAAQPRSALSRGQPHSDRPENRAVLLPAPGTCGPSTPLRSRCLGCRQSQPPAGHTGSRASPDARRWHFARCTPAAPKAAVTSAWLEPGQVAFWQAEIFAYRLLSINPWARHIKVSSVHRGFAGD